MGEIGVGAIKVSLTTVVLAIVVLATSVPSLTSVPVASSSSDDVPVAPVESSPDGFPNCSLTLSSTASRNTSRFGLFAKSITPWWCGVSFTAKLWCPKVARITSDRNIPTTVI